MHVKSVNKLQWFSNLKRTLIATLLRPVPASIFNKSLFLGDDSLASVSFKIKLLSLWIKSISVLFWVSPIKTIFGCNIHQLFTSKYSKTEITKTTSLQCFNFFKVYTPKAQKWGKSYQMQFITLKLSIQYLLYWLTIIFLVIQQQYLRFKDKRKKYTFMLLKP
jgi:hypothetical protein